MHEIKEESSLSAADAQRNWLSIPADHTHFHLQKALSPAS
jgi:hypothetical protein